MARGEGCPVGSGSAWNHLSATIQRDEDLPIQITSRKSIELRCGKSSIVMKADGTVTIRGTQILTRAERNNRIQGASVQLN